MSLVERLDGLELAGSDPEGGANVNLALILGGVQVALSVGQVAQLVVD